MNPRMQGVARQTLRMFQRRVGTDGMRNVILATSFWDQVNPYKGQARETALKSSPEYFASMIEKGSTYMRLGDRAQNFRLVDLMAKFQTIILQCQKEMVDGGMSAGNTAAARITAADIADLEAERRRHPEEERPSRDAQTSRQQIKTWLAIERSDALKPNLLSKGG
jgi:hypothetical protein